MTVPTKAELEAELAKLRRQNRALERRAERAESALGASAAREGDFVRQLGESREQQAAAGEVLRLIHSFPADITPVFEGILRSAVRLARALGGAMVMRDGDLLRLACAHGTTPEWHDLAQRVYPLRIDASSASGQAITERQAVFIENAQNSPLARVRDLARTMGYRSQLMVPMLRQGTALGVIALVWRELHELPPDQLALLQTFADQAVIAIENARLFGELEARNRELGESLEQQTATSEVLQVISSSPTALEAVYDVILDRITRLCEADIAALFLYDGEVLSAAASRGTTPRFAEHLRRSRPRPSHETTTRLAALERRPVHVADLLNDPEFAPRPRDLYEVENVRTVLSVPMLQEDRLIGVLTTWRREVRPFADRQVALLQTFADQAVIAIENARLFTQLGARNRDLTEALAQQTATGEILRTISSSPTDIQPVFDTIVRSAAHLCGAESAVVYRFADMLEHFVAGYSPDPQTVESYRPRVPRPVHDTDHLWRMAEGSVLNIGDIENDAELAAAVAESFRRRGVRSAVWVPMRRGTMIIGAINVAHRDVDAFSDARVDLLRTFADEAVIAIENVRLFKELDARNADLTEALDRQTATAEILRVISSSPTDVQPVFDTIARSASRLCGGMYAIVTRFDGELLHLVAQHNPRPGASAPTARLFPRRPGRDTSTGRAVLERAVVHVPDLEKDPRPLSRDCSARGRPEPPGRSDAP